MNPEILDGRSLNRRTPQVKICGLTRPDEAAACVNLGADAIGLVFFPPSPRNVSIDQACAVAEALPRSTTLVGVFVNAAADWIAERVRRCGLRMVQLHGQEPPEQVDRLRRCGIGVIKALFDKGRPGFAAAPRYRVDAFLAECAGGPLPGGNALAWDWKTARHVGAAAPLILAGGLSPDNIGAAIRVALPAAVDVSSGVEQSPGRKDLDKVARLLAAVRSTAAATGDRWPRPVFRTGEGDGRA